MRPLLESLEDRNMTFTINMMINNTGSAVHEGISRGIMIILIDIVGSNRKLLRFAQMVSEREGGITSRGATQSDSRKLWSYCKGT